MLYLIIGSLCLLLFCLLLYRDPRSFLNVIVLLAAVVLLFTGFAETTRHVEYVSEGIMLFFLFFVPLSLLFIAVLLILNGVFMLKREGRKLSNLLSMLAGFAMIAGMIATGCMLLVSTPDTMLMSFLWLGSILTVYVSATFTALLIYSLLYLRLPKDMHCDYIIVHGCGLLDGERVSPLLKGRLDKAAEVYKKLNGRAKLVLSGGQGADEKLSEAQAMENYLLGQGFPRDAMLLEDKSATTYENLRNVRDMLGGGREHRYLFVTSDYHVFRTGMFARDLGMNAAGIGCKTAMYYWPSAFIREYIAIMVRYKWITVAVLLLWLALTIESLLPI
ncbi:MAG: YdcF family protein [Lachnospiraceae bacterium]|jgi:uncharacterized SAM-binding protein YcdF (DUF218 family)|nr:YdcF family protein [Lachnospiraceae bacterium]